MNEMKIYQIVQGIGWTKQQSEEFVSALKENQQFASKQDVRELEANLRLEFERIRTLIEASARNSILTMTGIFSVLLAVVTYFSKH